jgi:1-phosphofructokinase
MLYTLTFSPSLDYYIDCGEIARGEVTRADSVRFELGGKGLNVSRVLKTLGVDSTAIILTGGFVGEEIIRRCKELEIDIINIKTAANSRINVKLPNREVNAPAPLLAESEINELTVLVDTFTKADTLILSGKIPDNVDIIKMFGDKPFSVICDLSGEALKDCLSLNPLIVKPNDAEIAEIFETKRTSDIKELVANAKKLLADEQYTGAKIVLLSLGDCGVMLIMPDKIVGIEPHLRKAVNAVAAGDSCLAGFIVGAKRYDSEFDALRLANAAGAAAAFSEGLPSLELIEELFNSEISAVELNL